MDKVQYIAEVLLRLRESESSKNVFQKPLIYCPGLTDKPWHNTENLDWIMEIESKSDLIGKELKGLNDNFNLFKEYREPGNKNESYRVLHDEGTWNVYYFYFEHKRFDKNCDLCPETAQLLDNLPFRTGLACFSTLSPGTHIPKHNGYFNFILRAHLGLDLPENDCKLRVGTESRNWEKGKCFIFDDTFDHEVWNNSNLPRTVLMIDFYHPDLTKEEVVGLRRLWRQPQAQKQIQSWIKVINDTK
mgnify:FL=1